MTREVGARRVTYLAGRDVLAARGMGVWWRGPVVFSCGLATGDTICSHSLNELRQVCTRRGVSARAATFG